MTIYGYDEAGRLVEEAWYDSEADADADRNRRNTIRWTYDAAGNLTSVVDDYSTYAYAYDARGRVTSETVAIVGGPVTVLEVGYGTRDDDRPERLAATVNGKADFVTTFEYDAENRLVAVRQTGQGGNAVADKYVTFAYAPNGALETIVRYESLDSSALVAVSRYTYDAYGRLVALVHYHDAGDPLAEYTWTYRGGGPVEVASGGAPANALAGFGFGLDSLLATATGGAAIRPLPEHVWSFDAAFTGLMTQMTSPDGMVEYSYDARGQLTGAEYTPHPAAEGSPARVVPGDESYTYDANGNRTNPGYVTGEYNRLLSDGTYAYEYDARATARSAPTSPPAR